MRRLLSRHAVRRTLSIVAVTIACWPCDAVWAAAEQKRVLVLYSTRRDAQIAIVGDREMPRILEQELAEGLDYYSEFIDRARFADADYQTAFREFLRSKYGQQRFDVVIAMDEMPLDFMGSHGRELFPETPVVFFSSRASPPRLVNSTGFISELNLGDTLALVAELQPDVRQVFVITGSSETGASYRQAADAQFRQFGSRFTITHLSGLRTSELETRVASLPAHSVIYYLIVDRDAANQNYHPLEYVSRITAVANAPVYSWVDSTMDRGIVGGSLKDQSVQARALAALAVRVLKGEPADSIPAVAANFNVSQVDWRQLRRWKISEARVPAGTLVRFREPSAWDRYRIYILGAATVLVGQSVLIAGLLVQRARRRQAEARIRDLGVRLLNAQESERSRIARELHDDISQQVALLEMDLELLGGALDGQAEGLAGDALHRAQGIAKSVHDLSHRLHPAKLRLIGLVSALKGLQRELSQPDFAIGFTHDRVPSKLPPEVTLCLFRIVQEALQNAIKYSGATHAAVHLSGTAEALELTIVDDGVGFDVDTAWGKGLGLISMDERVEAIGGRFDIRSKPGAGTRVTVRVPLDLVSGSTPSRSGDAIRGKQAPAAAGDAPSAFRADSA
jgi:signal transduction histidine kinase